MREGPRQHPPDICPVLALPLTNPFDRGRSCNLLMPLLLHPESGDLANLREYLRKYMTLHSRRRHAKGPEVTCIFIYLCVPGVYLSEHLILRAMWYEMGSVLSWFYRWRHRGIEGLPKVTQHRGEGESLNPVSFKAAKSESPQSAHRNWLKCPWRGIKVGQ